MKKNILNIFLCGLMPVVCLGQAANEPFIEDTFIQSCCKNSCCCDNYTTPAGIGTDHIHPKGEWMFSYSYMDMESKGAQIGNKSVGEGQVYNSYNMSPQTMGMQMHMLMAMYGVTKKFTVMIMGSVVSNDMLMSMQPMVMMMNGRPMLIGMMGGTMRYSESGVGDTKISGLYSFFNRHKWTIIGSLGLNIPTGSIKTNGTTMMGDNSRLPYSMQLGTGSYSVLPGITLKRSIGKLTLGWVADADIKMKKNSQGYKLGDVWHSSAWGGYKINKYLSGSLRADVYFMDKISGTDAMISVPAMMTSDPSFDPSNSGGKWLSMFAGLNIHFPEPVINRFRFLVEFGLPVYQNLNGTQTSINNIFNAGIQFKL